MLDRSTVEEVTQAAAVMISTDGLGPCFVPLHFLKLVLQNNTTGYTSMCQSLTNSPVLYIKYRCSYVQDIQPFEHGYKVLSHTEG